MHALVPNQTSIYHGTILQKVNVSSQKFLLHRLVVLKWGMRTLEGSSFQPFSYSDHFATQLMIPFQKFPVMHMKCSCVCTIENHND